MPKMTADELGRALEPLFALARGISMEQLKHHARVDDVKIKSASVEVIAEQPVTAQILIAGTDMEVVFRLHFSLEDAKRMVENRIGKGSGTRSLAIDLVRESSNLVSGRMKAFLETSGIVMAQGLPFVLKERHHRTKITTKRKGFALATWGLETKAMGEILCSMVIEIKNFDVLPKLVDFSNSVLPKSGDVEVF